jgi:hypothetical protein
MLDYRAMIFALNSLFYGHRRSYAKMIKGHDVVEH